MMLPEILQHTANLSSERGIGHIQRDGSVIFKTYPQLLAEAAGVLTGFNKLGLKAGDKVILALSRNEEFIPAFWGCLLGGIIPAPLAAPLSLNSPNPALEKLHGVWNVLGNPFALVPENLLTRDPEKPRDACLIPEDKLRTLPDVQQDQSATSFHTPQLTDTAFIQFSSGSTGQPKGVMLSHKNILSNLYAIKTNLKFRREDIILSWLPLFHDMGLIGYHIAPLYFCLNQFLLNTVDFIKRPLLWLDSLEKHGATVTAAPNFSQALVLERLKRDPQKHWDLSKVRLILNGAEPISVDLLQRFMQRMSGFGLDSGTMLPVYGLAEATLAVSFPALEEEPCIEHLDRHELHKHHRAVSAKSNDISPISFVSEGFPAHGCEVRIVNNTDHIVSDGAIGHIQVKGDNVMTGYYNNAAATREAFCEEWLRTGDLGFMREGRLCVTGRVKDILFVNGQNYYAHDLENIALKVDGVQSGKVAFCGWRNPEAESDMLLLFLAVRKPASPITTFLKLKQRLQRVLGLTVDIMIPLTSNQFPKTSSGKLQRYKLVEQFEQGIFKEAVEELLARLKEEEQHFIEHKIPPKAFTEKLLHKLWCDELLLKPENVGIHDHFADLGGMSINAVSILAKLEQHYYIVLDGSILAEHQTIFELAAYIDKHPTLVRPTEEGKRKKVFGG